MTIPAPQLDFATAATRLAHSRIRARERRRYRRLPLVASGRMLDTLGREHDCRTADISPGDVRIHAPVLPNVGERVVLYLEGFGRVSGSVARRGDGEAAIVFDFSAHKREKLTEQLTLAINKGISIDEPAQRPAIKDAAQFARIELESGESYQGEVLDFSLSGVTIRTKRPAPLIGDWVRIGNVYGRVARLIEGGFAVDFEPNVRSFQRG
jgi:hypothetical protein